MELHIDSNVNQLASEMSAAESRAMVATATWVARLTRYAEQKMKYHVPSRTKRSTGKLKHSIRSEVHLRGMDTEGIAYVPAEMGVYQFVIEGGRKGRGRRIYGNFSFPVENWAKGSKNANIRQLAVGGRFVFMATKKGIKMGDYKGSHFTAKSYKDLTNYFQHNRDKITRTFEGTLFFTSSVLR